MLLVSTSYLRQDLRVVEVRDLQPTVESIGRLILESGKTHRLNDSTGALRRVVRLEDGYIRISLKQYDYMAYVEDTRTNEDCVQVRIHCSHGIWYRIW